MNKINNTHINVHTHTHNQQVVIIIFFVNIYLDIISIYESMIKIHAGHAYREEGKLASIQKYSNLCLCYINKITCTSIRNIMRKHTWTTIL